LPLRRGEYSARNLTRRKRDEGSGVRDEKGMRTKKRAEGEGLFTLDPQPFLIPDP
jgi:hypothetical protein